MRDEEAIVRALMKEEDALNQVSKYDVGADSKKKKKREKHQGKAARTIEIEKRRKATDQTRIGRNRHGRRPGAADANGRHAAAANGKDER